jgi:hypothetical protein
MKSAIIFTLNFTLLGRFGLKERDALDEMYRVCA